MRTVDYSVSDIGPVVYLDGNDNYKVLDNDLLGTSTLIGTGSNQPGASFLGGGSATNGLIARNTLWNANAAHWLDSVGHACHLNPGPHHGHWPPTTDDAPSTDDHPNHGPRA